MRLKALAGALLLSWAAAAVAQTPTPPPPPPQWRFEMHGFVGGSLYVQDANLGPSEGQQALYVNNQTATTRAPNQDRIVFGGDVRQSRFNFSVAGPKVWGGATPKAVLEIDWFGGLRGTDPYGNVSLIPRMRLAYAELDWGQHRIQMGQNNDLIFAMAPVSLAHIAFPVGYGTGNIGWRRPAAWGYHTFGDVKNKDATKVEFAWEVGRSQWFDAPAASGAQLVNPGTAPPYGNTGDKFGFSLGETSGLPAVEARLTLAAGQSFSAFVGGHWQSVDRTGVDAGPVTTPDGKNLSDVQTIAGVAGFKLVGGPLTVAATGFYGKNLGPLIGTFIQFPDSVAGAVNGDIHEMGGWAQLGLNFTKEFSVWAFGGVDAPNRQDAINSRLARLQNTTVAGMLQYRDGGFAMGLEWFHFHTLTAIPSGTTGFSDALDGNQVLLTGLYFF